MNNNFFIIVPTPDVSTNFSWGANDLSISCLINTSIYVNTDIQVNVGWSNQDGITLINNSRTTISQTYLIKDAMNMYRSDFHLISPTINDNNEYTCSAIIQPLVGYLYIDNSETLRSTANITVLGMQQCFKRSVIIKLLLYTFYSSFYSS